MKDLVGPYRIRSLLGHGGMGIVYLGVHDHLGREVAIKALAPELTQHPEFRERFFAEARAQALLQHTNIVTVYDLIEDEGSFFIVMERVAGPTLEALLTQRGGEGWDLDRSLSIFRQILAGLDHAHSKGVIHRDVKPSNMLVAEGDLVKLTDFGIALLIGDKRLTASHSTIGTPTYMAPEQILRPRTVDHRADVYSAAVVLFEMLAGRPPYDAETEYEIKKLQIEAPVPDLRELRPEVPDPVAEALAIALHKDPGERFHSAGAFLRSLERAPAPAPEPVRPLPARELPRPPRVVAVFPWKPVAMAAAGVLLAGLSLLVYALRDTPEENASLPAQAVPAPPPLPTPRPAPVAMPPVEEPPPAVETPTQLLSSGSPGTPPPPRTTIPKPPEAEPPSRFPKPREDRPQPEEAQPRHEPEAPAPVATPAPEPIETPAPAARRERRSLKIVQLAVVPQAVPAGGKATAMVRVTLTPPPQEPIKLNVRASVKRNLDPIWARTQEVTLDPEAETWTLGINITIPPRLSAGDCYIEVELSDATRELRGLKRLGFTIR